MKKTFALAFLFLLSCAPLWAADNYIEGEALAVFQAPEGLAPSFMSASAAAQELHASIAETYETLSELEGKTFVLVRSETKTTEELISELKQRPEVLAASPNYKMRALASTSTEKFPNDPSADLCWGLKKIRAPEVWNYTTGSKNIYVCVIDSGMYRHPDLKANINAELGLNTATVSGDYDYKFTSWDVDYGGHGTHVAGTIGAVGNNNLGVAGVNWAVSMFSVRVFDNDEYETVNKEIRAINYIAHILETNPEMKLAAVNMSLGAYLDRTPEEMKNDVYYLAFQALDRLNRTLVVVAAGNDGLPSGQAAAFDDRGSIQVFHAGSYVYPASFTGLQNFIVVGAIASDDKAAYFSNWGDSVDIAAPGVSILSTVPMQEYRTASGTSMAAPHVTGAAALLMSAFPNATPGQIKAALLNGANKEKNPLVYPYAYAMESYRQRYEKMVDEYIQNGTIPAENREAALERVMQRVHNVFELYQQYDGTGRVSRNGLLDVKAAYDILASQPANGVGSSGGGCNFGFTFLIAIAGAALLKKFHA